jgi:hypothetical protein
MPAVMRCRQQAPSWGGYRSLSGLGVLADRGLLDMCGQWLAFLGGSRVIGLLRGTSRGVPARRGVSPRRRAWGLLKDGELGRPGRGRVFPAVLVRVRHPGITVAAARATQTLGMAPGQAEGATALMFATELVTPGRVVTRCGPVTHCGQFSRGEHLKLPHVFIIPPTDGNSSFPIGRRSCQIHWYRAGAFLAHTRKARRRDFSRFREGDSGRAT